MKKIILSAIAVFAFGFANAQETKFGAKVGLNYATLTGDVEDASAIVGFQVGGFAEIKISDKFAVQPELLFSTQGAKFDGIKSNLNYLIVPVMAKYYVADSFSLEAGPQVGFLMSAKADGEDFKDEMETVDFGLNFGAGYDFTENLSAGLRYNLGLSNINAVNEPGYNPTVKNNVFSLSLGYKF